MNQMKPIPLAFLLAKPIIDRRGILVKSWFERATGVTGLYHFRRIARSRPKVRQVALRKSACGHQKTLFFVSTGGLGQQIQPRIPSETVKSEQNLTTKGK
jgi:hypothetical protein